MTDSDRNSASACGHHQRPRRVWVFVAFALMAAALLWSEHRAHVLGLIPYLVLFACPLMHLLHHRGHGHKRHREDRHA